jgi:hypothetical protein
VIDGGAEVGTTFHPVFSGSLLKKKCCVKTLSPATSQGFLIFNRRDDYRLKESNRKDHRPA